VTWVRLDTDCHADGRLRRARAVSVWPAVLCAMKRGNGIATDDDLDPVVISDLWQMDEATVTRAIGGLRAVGMLVECEGGWTTPRWSEHQPDPTNSERQRAFRERNRQARDAATEPVRNGYAPLRNDDVTARNGEKRNVTPDRTGHTGQDIQDSVLVEVDGTTSRARVEPAQLPPPPPPDGLGAVVEAFRRTQSGRQAMQVSPATVASLATMVTAHGHEAMVEAIRRASERCQGDLTIAYLRPVVAAVAAGEPEQRGRRVERKPSAAYQSEEPVASPRVVTEGLL
jgi:hypothetical protein